MKKWVKYLAFALGLVLLAWILIPEIGSTGDHWSESTYTRAKIRETAVGITSWMMSGARVKTADSMSEIPAEFLPAEHRMFVNPKTECRAEWLYFGQYLDGRSPSHSTILLAAPKSFIRKNWDTNKGEEFRVVAFCDSRTEAILEIEFKERISAQIDSFKERKGWK